MNKSIVTGGILLVIVVIGILYVGHPFFGKNSVIPSATPTPKTLPQNMKLTSSSFGTEEMIPQEFTCDGKGIHPPLTIAGVPVGTISLAIIVDDPDAPMGTFNHWTIWNIDPSTTSIAVGQEPPKSQEGTNSAGKLGFTPPCPPKGPAHRYFFTLYALDTTIGLDGKAKKDDLVAAMNGHIMQQTNLIGAYGR